MVRYLRMDAMAWKHGKYNTLTDPTNPPSMPKTPPVNKARPTTNVTEIFTSCQSSPHSPLSLDSGGPS